MPSNHAFLTSPSNSSALGVWSGRLSFVTAGGGGNQQAVITDSTFTSRIVRASNHILLTPANLHASIVNYRTTLIPAGMFVAMTNNASILVNYQDNAAGTATYYFLIFGGGTST